MTDAQQKTAAKKFAEYWQGKGYEKGESQPFWLSLLRDVYGIEEPEKYISFEDQVKLDKAGGFIDGYISATHTMIEQKGSNQLSAVSLLCRCTGSGYVSPFAADSYSAETLVAVHVNIFPALSNYEIN